MLGRSLSLIEWHLRNFNSVSDFIAFCVYSCGYFFFDYQYWMFYYVISLHVIWEKLRQINHLKDFYKYCRYPVNLLQRLFWEYVNDKNIN